MQLFLVAFAVLAGLLNTIQTGANTALNKGLGAPVWAAVAVDGDLPHDVGGGPGGDAVRRPAPVR